MDPNILRLRTAIAHQRTCEAAPVIAWSIGRPLSESEMKLLATRSDKMRSPIHVREATCLKQHELIADLLAAAADALAIAKPQVDEAAIAPKIDEADPAIVPEFDDLTIAQDTPEQDSTIAPDHEQDAEPVSAPTEGDTDTTPKIAGELVPVATSDPTTITPEQEREIDLAIANATAMTRRKGR